MNLGAAFSQVGITLDSNTSPGNLSSSNGESYSYSSSQLGSSVNWNGVSFSFGPAGSNDAVQATGQTLTLPAGNYGSLRLVGTAIGGLQSNATFTVRYTDGTQATFTQSFSDWVTGASGPGTTAPGEALVSTMAYGNQTPGTHDNINFYMYGHSFALDPSKTVASVTLPSNSNIKIFAMDLVP